MKFFIFLRSSLSLFAILDEKNSSNWNDFIIDFKDFKWDFKRSS